MIANIPEGGDIPEGNWFICRGSVYGDWPKTEDYQGWYWVIKLPAYHWFADGEMWFRETWAQRVIYIRHLWLGKGRRGRNGTGWQGWDWSLQWIRCNIDNYGL